MARLCPRCNARYLDAPARCPLDQTPLVDEPDTLLGAMVGGRYRLTARVGAGTIGAVYRARHAVLQRDVAVKVLDPRLADDPVLSKRFLGEAEATNLLRHENIVDISDFGADGRLLYLVMELLDGESLGARIARGPLPPAEALDVAADVTRALARAHELPVLHRDIKPSSVVLCVRPKRAKVCDFGFAQMHREARLTLTGQILGTPAYMSPEQARGDGSTEVSDLYALGVVLFEMLTARRPFEGSFSEVMLLHARAEAPRVGDLAPSVPEALSALVARLLSKAPSARPRDAAALLDELLRLRAALAPEAPIRAAATPEPVAPAVSHAPSPNAPLDGWKARRGAFDAAFAAAHGAAVPYAAQVLLDDFDRELGRLAQIESEAATLADEVLRLEREGETRRARFVATLDALVADEAEGLREDASLTRARDEARDAASTLRASLTDALLTLAASVGAAPVIDLDLVARVHALDAKAAAWEEAARRNEALALSAQRREAARQDVSFQIAQCRGRIAAIGADVEHDATDLRARITALGPRRVERAQRLADLADALTKQVASHPEAARIVDAAQRL